MMDGKHINQWKKLNAVFHWWQSRAHCRPINGSVSCRWMPELLQAFRLCFSL